MSDEPKRPRGRPPRDPSSAPGGSGPKVFHLGLRFNRAREAQLKRIVDAMNERAQLADIAVDVTVSSMVHKWIVSRIDEEIAKLDAAAKRKR